MASLVGLLGLDGVFLSISCSDSGCLHRLEFCWIREAVIKGGREETT